jgi:gas vesicle protein
VHLNGALFVGANIEDLCQDPEYPQKENFMNNTGRTIFVFLAGLGIGAGLAALFTPQSGEETREWIADTAERKFKVLRRVGRRSLRQLQDALTEGEEKVTGVLRNGKKALESVATKLD